MNLENFLVTYWWLLFWLIPMIFLWIRQKEKSKDKEKVNPDLDFILIMGFIILLIYLIQRYLFSEHKFFLIGIPFFTIILTLLINYLLKGRDIYVLESTILNEKHYDLINMQKIISPSSSNKLLVMDKSVYEAKSHVGEAKYPFWSGSDRIKFCDFYDRNNGIFYHPELPQFHNVSIYMARAFLLKAKMDIPKLYRDNILLTWLSPYKTAHQQSLLAKNFPLHLTAIKQQYDYEPFKLPETIDEIFDNQFNESLLTQKSSENLKSMDEIKKEITELIKQSNNGDGNE